MIIKWFQTWLRGKTYPADASPKEKMLVDVAHEVLSKEALEKSQTLKGLEKFGWPFLKRRQKKEKIRSKVRRFLSLSISEEENFEVVDEITEKIAEACEADPEINRLFEDRETPK